MNDLLEDLHDLLDWEGRPVVMARALAYWTNWGIHAWCSAIQSPSWWCRCQATLTAAVIAMYAVVLAWGRMDGDLPTWTLVTGAIVITAGWTAIAGAAAGRMVTRFKNYQP